MSEQESRLFENPNQDNYREFLKSRGFKDIVFLALSWVNNFLNDNKINIAFSKFISNQDLSDKEIEALEDLFRYNRFLWKLSQLFTLRNLDEKEWDINFESFIEFIIRELAFRKIWNTINDIIKKVERKLDAKIIFSSEKYELVRIWGEYFLYLKDKNEVYKRHLDFAQKENYWNVITQNNWDIFITADWEDYLIRYQNWENEVLVSLKTWKIIELNDLKNNLEIIFIDWKTIVIFNWETGITQICVETWEIYDKPLIDSIEWVDYLNKDQADLMFTDWEIDRLFWEWWVADVAQWLVKLLDEWDLGWEDNVDWVEFDEKVFTRTKDFVEWKI